MTFCSIWNRVFPYGKSRLRASCAALAARMPSPESLRGGWLHRRFGDRIFHADLWVPSRSSLAMGLAVGWFFGLLPVFGLQIALALLFGLILRGHFPTAVLGTFISNPLTTPALLVVQYALGHKMARIFNFEAMGLEPMVQHGIALGAGTVASAAVAALVGYGGAWCVWGWTRRGKRKTVGGLRASGQES